MKPRGWGCPIACAQIYGEDVARARLSLRVKIGHYVRAAPHQPCLPATFLTPIPAVALRARSSGGPPQSHKTHTSAPPSAV
jgi:hypothetical protein